MRLKASSKAAADLTVSEDDQHARRRDRHERLSCQVLDLCPRQCSHAMNRKCNYYLDKRRLNRGLGRGKQDFCAVRYLSHVRRLHWSVRRQHACAGNPDAMGLERSEGLHEMLYWMIGMRAGRAHPPTGVLWTVMKKQIYWHGELNCQLLPPSAVN